MKPKHLTIICPVISISGEGTESAIETTIVAAVCDTVTVEYNDSQSTTALRLHLPAEAYHEYLL